VPAGDNDEIYDRFSGRRKMLITFVVSFCSFLAHVSSTTVLSAVPEVSSTFGCDGSIINLSNALYMLFMGISPMFYGPLGNVYGRKRVRIDLNMLLPPKNPLWTNTTFSGVSGSRFAVFRLLHRDCSCAQSRCLFRLSNLDCFPRDCVLGHWVQCHRRYLQAH
jgi:hypothetical protein